MRFFVILLSTVFITFAQQSLKTETNIDGSKIRITVHTTMHLTTNQGVDAKNVVTVLTGTGKTFWFYRQDNKDALATLLAAKTNGNTIDISYDDGWPFPWDSSCKAMVNVALQ